MRRLHRYIVDADSAGFGARQQRGTVLVITLLALVLLAALLFYVMNLGRQAQTRVETQAAADAAAAAGSGWAARTFNTVAMHNVDIARLITLVSVMDSTPMAVQFAHEDQAAILKAVDGQLNRGVDGSWVEDGLERFRSEIQAEVDQLAPMDRLLNESGYDIRAMTFYESPSGTGHLWRAMLAMDAHSRAAMENLSQLTQANAVQGGLTNLAGVPATAMVIPAEGFAGLPGSGPGVPWKRGRFDDFERPVRFGLLPVGSDDPVVRRGPYDVLFGWRQPVGGKTLGHYKGTHKSLGGGSPGVPIGRGPGNDTFIHTGQKPEKYRVYGPLTHMFYALASMAKPNLPHSRFADYSYAPPNTYWINTLAKMKLNYLWPGGPIQNVVDPQWQTSFVSAVAIAESDPSRIKETAFVVIEIKSRYPRGHARFLSPGSWAYVEEEQPLRPSPHIVWARGWVDPRNWFEASGGAVRLVGNYVWRDEWSYSAVYDSQIGLTQRTEGGVILPQKVYRIDDYVFAGVNVGEEVPVRNPYNFGSKEDLPAPIDLDHELIGEDAVSRRRFLTFLGVASRDNRALFWPDGFDSGREYPRHVAVAQAAVFNNHSFDLWTQMWYAQSERIDSYDAWVNGLDAAGNPGGTVPGLESNDVMELYERLRDLEPLAPMMLSH